MSFVPLQTTTKQVATSASTTMAMTNNTVSGSALLVCVVTGSSTANSVTSITDSLGNTYTKVASTVAGGGFNPDTELWYAKNIYGGATTLTVNINASLDFGIIAREYPDLAHSNPLDTSITAAIAGGGTVTATTAVTRYTTELVVAVGGQATTGVTWTVGSGMGNLSQIGTVGTTAAMAMEDKVVSTNAAVTAAFGGTASSNAGFIVAVFNSRQAVVQSRLRPHPFSPGLAR